MTNGKEYRITIESLTDISGNVGMFVVTLLDDSKAPRPTLACTSSTTLQEAVDRMTRYVIEAYEDRSAPALESMLSLRLKDEHKER